MFNKIKGNELIPVFVCVIYMRSMRTRTKSRAKAASIIVLYISILIVIAFVTRKYVTNIRVTYNLQKKYSHLLSHNI